ncbi:MAG: calcium/sodium antiporter [Flavihumibacter sp.]|jgi:cation:H+ antiporter|nr:calcium/sodium antiporter [Flavihumibacter sp.]
MVLPPVVVFLIGLVVIILGAELVLRTSTRIANFLGIKPIIIGLTVVSIGTSMPELAVGITAAAEGKGALAIGNIAGTNIMNILFILGLSAAIRALPLHAMSIKLDLPVMIGAAIALTAMAWDGVLQAYEGILLLLAAVVYTVVLIRFSRMESASIKKEYEEEYEHKRIAPVKTTWLWVWNIILLGGGIYLTIIGAEWLVSGAVTIASSLGVSDAIIGLTIVAVGTSAPELVTTVIATIKNDRDVAVGNLIGSSITNVLVILGITCILAPGGIDVSKDILWFDLPLAALVAIICYPVFRSDKQISRTEGAVFVSLYLIYFTSLILFRT